MRLFSRWTIDKVLHKLGYHLVRESSSQADFKGYEPSGQSMPLIDRLPDSELKLLNDLLPWASFVVDKHGRRFGQSFANNKRTQPEIIPDPRILELDQRIPLANLTVLELGCFEGNHTCALAARAHRVIAVDARIEHIVKTIVRCAMFGLKPDVFCLDLEEPLPEDVDLSCDVLHHVGVLYHLTDPVRHLRAVCALTRKTLLLDTHVAADQAQLSSYSVDGQSYHYMEFAEGGRSGPFAGMRDHAKWLTEADLLAVLKLCGFSNIEVSKRSAERYGPRVLIYASRE